MFTGKMEKNQRRSKKFPQTAGNGGSWLAKEKGSHPNSMISIKGPYFPLEKRQIMIDFTEWCANKLLSSRMRKQVSISIHGSNHKKFTKEGLYGLTEVHQDDDWNRPRNFTIRITNKFKILRCLVIIAHEMVHIKQQTRGELTYCGRTGVPKWNGVLVCEKTDYWDLPWEIEAHGREKGLVYQWAEARGYREERWMREIF